ncbi:30S ribosomal protein S14 [Deinococcus rubellus]|uniref:Small ribosomal subunit protein uS14 n=1 Tax=Deinococcus rubellus TaxID=1889240 RepID=A0ABY5YIB4_9DEIO|nr:30S ribosomal protein S14 [Deinococcus rubellus]UWX64676.1 30S ribosomal protein S14 [Deinococcus rubellus]
MAKTSKIVKQKQREAVVAKYADKRQAMKDAGDYYGLSQLPRDASPTRLHNRCEFTGRPRGYIRFFGVSRIVLREMASRGELPGVRKASW